MQKVNLTQLQLIDAELRAKHFAFRSENANGIIFDGIIDHKMYALQKLRVLFIGQEAYDKANNGEGGWELHSLLDERAFLNKHPSWNLTAKIAWGLHNDFILATESLNVTDEEAEALGSCAFINLSKQAGGSRTSNKKAGFWNENKQIICRQVAAINPNVIIGWGVSGILVRDTEFLNCWDFKDCKATGGEDYFYTPDKIMVNYDHPAYYRSNLKKQDYIYSTIACVREWSSNNR